MLTGAVIYLTAKSLEAVSLWMKEKHNSKKSDCVKNLLGENAFIVPKIQNEFQEWRTQFLDTRDNQAHIFTLHFLPTLQCQFHCNYCFENGINRNGTMSPQIIEQSKRQLNKYFLQFPEIDTFRLAFFGGEPLLCKDTLQIALEIFHKLATKHNIDFYSEITTNGEFLDKKIAKIFAQHNWRRVQITLDGQKEIHNVRRFGTNKRPTFDNIMKNIQMLLSSEFVSCVDIRVSLDLENFDSVQKLIYDLSKLNNNDRINLSIGIITSSLSTTTDSVGENKIAQKALSVWKVAQECGFNIPEDFIVGPWCVAIAKHSAVLQPNGALQKCFCTSGRSKYEFGHITETFSGYMKDNRFEYFQRTDMCIAEQCEYIPVCGGGCIHDAIVLCGQTGFKKRFCQKQLIVDMNIGLLELNYG